MSRFLNEKFCRLEAYTPGEQPQDKKYIKLNTNESPFPPSKGVLEAVNQDAVSQLNLYPDPECKELRETIAKHYGVLAKNVFVGNGSDDILSFAFMAFCGKNSNAAFPDISYGFYRVYAELHGVPYVEIPLKSDFSVNAEDYIGINKNVFIANPNAPTGLTLSLEQISKICESNKDNIVLIDEAYVDFGAESSVNLTKKYDNLITVMTYSKSRSMAGARLGFAIASEAIIEDLNKIKYSTNPYSINRLTNLAGIAAIKDNDYYADNCKKIVEVREYTKSELEKLGFDFTDSKSNFIFAKNGKIDGETLYKKLKDKGILVRHFSKERIKDFVRITVGTKEQMDKLLDAVREIL
ncbi:MAG: histidinol-phosphate transaminase [Ruminococcaceae bacterium]|nr:histidinol-phosphate transaminase [Oscillospiraceae bacterium]